MKTKNRNRKHFKNKSWNAFMKNRFRDKVDIKLTLRIGGKVRFIDKKRYFGRNHETSVFYLRQLGQILYSEVKRNFHSCDGVFELLKEYESVLKKQDNETADSIFNDYWIKDPEVKEKEFKLLNRQKLNQSLLNNEALNNDAKRKVEWNIISAIHWFENLNIEEKYAILYHIYSDHENSDIEEMQQDINATPEIVKSYLNNIYNENKAN